MFVTHPQSFNHRCSVVFSTNMIAHSFFSVHVVLDEDVLQTTACYQYHQFIIYELSYIRICQYYWNKRFDQVCLIYLICFTDHGITGPGLPYLTEVLLEKMGIS